MKKLITCFTSFLLTSAFYAQSELAVNCYDSGTPFNSVSIDNEIVEYSVCGLQQSFYVAVIDPATCTAWGTNYNGANPTHAFGNLNEGSCRQRVEYYFIFDANSASQLDGMRNMLETIPAGHSIIIYTPVSYDYTVVNTSNPSLVQALESRWDPAVIQGNQIMVLYGVAGDPNSFVEETTQNQGQISFSTAICTGSLSVMEQQVEEKLVLQQNGHFFMLNPDLQILDLQVLDASGKQVSFTRTENTVQLPEGTGAGVYLFQANGSGKCYRSKQLVSF
jgi:hypothetical protein